MQIILDPVDRGYERNVKFTAVLEDYGCRTKKEHRWRKVFSPSQPSFQNNHTDNR